MLIIDMKWFPGDQKELRISMDHKDNQPLELSRIEAFYRARTLVFLSMEKGTYELVGGHPDKSFPVYDLSLVQNVLLGIEPVDIKAGPVTIFEGEALRVRISKAFSSQGWGLYIILASVTLVLLFIIIRLFPKEPLQTNKD